MITKTITDKNTLNPFIRKMLSDDTVLFDIETTGLNPAVSHIYCIGCGHAAGDEIVLELFFANCPEEEPEIIRAFFEKIKKFKKSVTFNGAAFDIPFINKRAAVCGITGSPSGSLAGAQSMPAIISHTDLYREIRKIKPLLGLSSYRQKSLEQFLGTDREDEYDGGRLISVYHEYVYGKNPDLLRLLLLHNRDDVRGMFNLIDILAYRQLADGDFLISEAIYESAENMSYINVKLTPRYHFPQNISKACEDSLLLIDSGSALVRFRVKHGTLRHFFDDPENYYYLPDEDCAMHKSVSSFTDASHRVRATLKNCYIKKECDYIDIPVRTDSGFLKKSYNDSRTYLEIPCADDAGLKAFLLKYFSIFFKC